MVICLWTKNNNVRNKKFFHGDTFQNRIIHEWFLMLMILEDTWTVFSAHLVSKDNSSFITNWRKSRYHFILVSLKTLNFLLSETGFLKKNTILLSKNFIHNVFISDPPKIVSVGRDKVKTAILFSPMAFECMGEGNPPPTYQWLQKLPSPSSMVIERSRDAKLYISNVTYDYQGEYTCKVRNIIKGEERMEISEPIILQVHGEYIVMNFNEILDGSISWKFESIILFLILFWIFQLIFKYADFAIF